MAKRKPKAVDMQTHSWYSDGTESPPEIMRKAKELGMKGVVITDHNIVEGWEEAKDSAKENGLVTTIGIEFYSRFVGQDVHILGYRFELTDEINKLIESQSAPHERRAKKIMQKYRNEGYDLDLDEVKSASYGYPSRFDIASTVARKFHIPVEQADMQSRRRKYGGAGGFADVDLRMPHTNMMDVIRIINNAGGISVIAHPGEYKFDSLTYILEAAISVGVRAVELHSPKNPPEVKKLVREIGKKAGLYFTGGSDYHGARKKVMLGDEGISYRAFKRILDNP